MDSKPSHRHSHLHEVAKQTTRRLSLSLGLTLAFVVVEAGAGLVANSLALLTDAAHNLTDVIALGLSVIAIRLATRPSTAGSTFGFHRAGIMVALVNSSGLVIVAGGILIEAVRRLLNPGPVDGGIL